MSRTRGGRSRRLATLALLGAVLFFTGVGARAEDTTAGAFEQANGLYEQGRFGDAASEYRKLLGNAGESTALHYNLANSEFKAGHSGEAVAHYLEAARLSPRDRDVRANLEFARSRLASGARRLASWWEGPLFSLTLNEWFTLTFAALWIWGALFAAGRLMPKRRPGLRAFVTASATLAVLFGIALATATWRRAQSPVAVVVVRDAAVRNGPLDESKTAYSLPEGTEVRLLERKSGWLLIRAARSPNAGWVHDASLHVVGDFPTQRGRPGS